MSERENEVVIEGMEDIIRRDLEKNKAVLERAQHELLAYRQALSHEIAKKKHYKNLIGGGKFNDDSLIASMKDIAVNIQHMSDKVKLTQNVIKHRSIIVDTLTDNLENQMQSIRRLANYRVNHKKE